jgi:hypothetical protein
MHVNSWCIRVCKYKFDTEDRERKLLGYRRLVQISGDAISLKKRENCLITVSLYVFSYLTNQWRCLPFQ